MNIKCIFYDFDGVMTDNKVILSENGEESVIVNRSDGLAISYFKKLDIHQYIISSEQNPVVTKRANNKHKIKNILFWVRNWIDNTEPNKAFLDFV